MGAKAKRSGERVHWITPEEGREIFEREAQRSLNMSGEEFLRKWDAGEFDPLIDDPKYHTKIISVYMLMPLVRHINGSDGR